MCLNYQYILELIYISLLLGVNPLSGSSFTVNKLWLLPNLVKQIPEI